jgi:hypothetical protein
MSFKHQIKFINCIQLQIHFRITFCVNSRWIVEECVSGFGDWNIIDSYRKCYWDHTGIFLIQARIVIELSLLCKSSNHYFINCLQYAAEGCYKPHSVFYVPMFTIPYYNPFVWKTMPTDCLETLKNIRYWNTCIYLMWMYGCLCSPVRVCECVLVEIYVCLSFISSWQWLYCIHG